MQNVTFVDSQGQAVANISMDVPRQGELIVFQGHGFTVFAVRWYLYPNGTSRAVVLLTPYVNNSALTSHYQSLAPND